MTKVRDAIKTDNADSIKWPSSSLNKRRTLSAKRCTSRPKPARPRALPAAGATGSAGAADGKKPGEEEAIDAEFEVKE